MSETRATRISKRCCVNFHSPGVDVRVAGSKTIQVIEHWMETGCLGRQRGYGVR